MKTTFKNILCLATLIILSCNTYLSHGQVGINTTTPSASSMLDITSTNKGILIPRMTSVQRLAIPTPATGLMVYETTTNQFFYFDGIIWRPMASNNSAWNTTGNSGTSPIVNFIGTNDINDFVIRTNNTERMRVTSNGNVGIGTSAPTQKLSISAGMSIDNSNINNGNLVNALVFGGLGSDEGIASKQTVGGNQHGLDFYQGGINRMRIWNDGNIAIGQTSGGSLIPNADLTILDTSVTSTSDVAVFTAHHSGSAGTTWRMGSVEFYTEGLSNIGFSSKLSPLTGPGFVDLGSSVGTKYDGFRWHTLFCATAPDISSDTTLKENIQPVVYGLNQLRKINPISYQFKKDFGGTDKELTAEDKRTFLGFNAQELKEVLPEVVSSWTWVSDNEKGYKKAKTKTLGVRYDEVIPVVVNAVKEIDKQQQSIIEVLNISDFGTEQSNTTELKIEFNNDFAQKLQGKPIVTITSLQSDVTLYISDVTSTGFTVKSNSKNVSEISFNWMAMAKINKGAIENKSNYTEEDHANKLKEIKAFEDALPTQDEVISTRK